MISPVDPVETYAAADEALLREIVRQAEARLNEQGEVTRSAEQKAVQITAVLGTLAAAGFPIAAQAWESNYHGLSVGAAVAGALCFVASLLAVAACFPEKFDVVGNDPANWLEDIAAKKPLTRTLAETAHNYDQALKRNRVRMVRRRFLLVAALILFCLAAPAALIGALMAN